MQEVETRGRRGRKRILGNADPKKLKIWLAEGPKKHGFESDTWQLDTILETLKR